MKTLTNILTILFLSVVSPIVADEVIETQNNSIQISELALSLTADFNTAQVQIGYDIEDEIANLDRINQVSRAYLKREHLNHVQHIDINSRAFPRRNRRILAAE